MVYEQQRTAYMMRRWIPPPFQPDAMTAFLHGDPMRHNLMVLLPFFGLCGIGLAFELVFQASCTQTVGTHSRSHPHCLSLALHAACLLHIAVVGGV
jgi:hypothetical protein